MKKSVNVILIVFIIGFLSFSIVSANIFEDFWKWINSGDEASLSPFADVYVENYCAQVGGYDVFSGEKTSEGYGITDDELKNCYSKLDDGDFLDHNDAILFTFQSGGETKNCGDYVCSLYRGIVDGILTSSTTDKKCMQENGFPSDYLTYCQSWCPKKPNEQIWDGTKCELYNPSQVGAICGNNILEGEEECDTQKLNGESCISLGYDGGILRCKENCFIDEDGCITYTEPNPNFCGNGIINAGEQCDDFNTLSGDGCNSICQINSGWSCQGEPSECTQIPLGESACGNAVVDNGEICDSNSRNCRLNGLYGSQSCSSNCLGWSVCVPDIVCGNGVIQGDEVCDGNSNSCLIDGQLGVEYCSNDCQGFDECVLISTCGNGIINDGEECDIFDFGDATCEDYPGYSGGILNCNYDCTINIDQCEIEPSDIKISTATLNQYYYVGDKIELTDPPEEIIEGNSFYLRSSNLNVDDTEEDVEILGYFVKLKEKPIIEEEIIIQKELNELKDKSILYKHSAEDGSIILSPYRNWRSSTAKNNYEKLNENSKEKIKKLRENIDDEHSKFLDSVKDVVDGIEESVTEKNNVGGIKKSGRKIKNEYGYAFNGFALDITKEEAEQIKKLDGVEAVYPDYEIKVDLDSSIPSMEIDDARNYAGLDGEGVTIAIIDTGIDDEHDVLDDLDDDPLTNDPKVIGFMDFINFESEPYDDHGHGTHVSGIAAGTGGEERRYIGVAPKANLVGVKVLDGGGSGSFSQVLAGIEWTIQHKEEYGIDIISMSLGANINGDGTSPLEVAVDYAMDSGITTVVAAGNAGAYGSNTVGVPGSAKKIITVGAVDDSSEIAYFSSRGPTKDGRIKPEVSAVGVDVTSSTPNNNYEEWSGTSMATPHVSGFIALLLQQNPF